jgi:hypothetical protein
VKHPRTSSIRRVCPEPAVNRGARFTNNTSTTRSARIVPPRRFSRHANLPHNRQHDLMVVRSSYPATFWRPVLLCLSLALGCSQRHAVLGGLLIRRSNTPLKFTSDHTGLYLLTRERPHRADIFLSPRTQLGSLLRHLCSLIRSRISDHRKLKSKFFQSQQDFAEGAADARRGRAARRLMTFSGPLTLVRYVKSCLRRLGSSCA